MSDVPQNSALAEILGSITDRGIRRKVQKLLQYGEEAVRALGELDAALYVREDGEEQLQIVSDAVMSHFRRLLEYLAMVAPAQEASAALGGDDVDFDLAGDDGGTGSGRAESSPPVRKSGPISTRSVIAQRKLPDDEKWASLMAEMDTLQYGLSSELREYDRRFSVALDHDRREQALRDINDATTALMDGVFAVMTTVYECFLGHAEPERMVPGHRDTLGKALAVRMGLAILRREVRDLNRPLQDRATPKDVAEDNYRRIVDALGNFIQSDVYFYLRSDTRIDFERFYASLAEGNAARNYRESEGFDKYLDSLAFISQRGVLIKHDTDLKASISEDLERAVTYAAVLPEVACEVIEQAIVKGERLFGLSDQIDSVVERWANLSEFDRGDVQTVVSLGRELLELVRPPATPPPSAGDFF